MCRSVHRGIGVALALVFARTALCEQIALGRYVATVPTKGARCGYMKLTIDGREICREAGDIHVCAGRKRYVMSKNANASVEDMPGGKSITVSNKLNEVGFECSVVWTFTLGRIGYEVKYRFVRDSKSRVEIRLGNFGNALLAGCKYDVVTKSIEYHDVMPETFETKGWQTLIGKFKSVRFHTKLGVLEMNSRSRRRGLYPTLYLIPGLAPENVLTMAVDTGVVKGQFAAGYENTFHYEISLPMRR